MINFETCLSDENIGKTKKYYIVPLKLQKSKNGSDNQSHMSYKIDSKLLQKVERLYKNGYKNEQKSIINYLDEK